MTGVARRLAALEPKRRVAVQATLSAAAAYYLALLGAQIGDVLDADKWWLAVLHAGFSITVLAAVAVVVRSINETISTEVDKRRNVLSTAATQVSRCVIGESQRLLDAQQRDFTDVPLVRHDPLDAMFHLVKACYNTLEAHYGESLLPGERVAFEATFMTRDPNDNELTVLAWANREGRRPDSLRDRDRNPHTYDRSVTADIYREAERGKPLTRIVENTDEPGEAYAELYPGQKERIKSSIVYPVLSTNSELLGTLVVHCNEAHFFKKSDSRFWLELLDTFAHSIALEKLRFDYQHAHQRETGGNGGSRDTGGAPDAS